MMVWDGGSVLKQERSVEIAETVETVETTIHSNQRRSWVLGVTSLLFILLQSACSAIMAISGLRLLIGIGSFAAASSVTGALDAIHGDWLRLPMMALALTGTCINLYVIRRVRSLRARSSSQWRMAPVDPKKRRAEAIQLWISYATLILLVAEWATHMQIFGRFI